MGPRRRRSRDHEFDDELERSYGESKRMKGAAEHGDQPKLRPADISQAAAMDPDRNVCPATNDDDESKIERQRSKSKLRKERKKEKLQQRLKEAKEQQELKAARTKVTPNDIGGTTVKNDVVLCRKGVQYQDIVIGKGPVVQDRKKIHVKYTLRKATATGKVIDSSDMFGFRIGKGEVIQGWDIGLEGMKQGGIRHLLIPPEAGYGQKDIGAGKGGMLFFKVTLLAC